MNRKYILYNPYAGNGRGKSEAEILEIIYDDPGFCDMTQIESYAEFFAGLDPSDDIVLCGGDGTLNRFANDARGLKIPNTIYLYPVGSRNDFARDLGFAAYADPSFPVNQYLERLPSVEINGEERLFINGIGFGIDGYCCAEGDRLRSEKPGKKVSYTAIAVKGLLFCYKPTNAVVTVDGKKYTYEKVWLAPVMKGRYYGGGMTPTPGQNRLAGDTLSLMVVHGAGKLRALMLFRSIFKGEHIRHKREVAILRGRSITVEFDRPAPLQIDGETVLYVTSYTAKTSDRRVAAQ